MGERRGILSRKVKYGCCCVCAADAKGVKSRKTAAPNSRLRSPSDQHLPQGGRGKSQNGKCPSRNLSEQKTGKSPNRKSPSSLRRKTGKSPNRKRPNRMSPSNLRCETGRSPNRKESQQNEPQQSELENRKESHQNESQ